MRDQPNLIEVAPLADGLRLPPKPPAVAAAEREYADARAAREALKAQERAAVAALAAQGNPAIVSPPELVRLAAEIEASDAMVALARTRLTDARARWADRYRMEISHQLQPIAANILDRLAEIETLAKAVADLGRAAERDGMTEATPAALRRTLDANLPELVAVARRTLLGAVR